MKVRATTEKRFMLATFLSSVYDTFVFSSQKLFSAASVSAVILKSNIADQGCFDTKTGYWIYSLYAQHQCKRTEEEGREHLFRLLSVMSRLHLWFIDRKCPMLTVC